MNRILLIFVFLIVSVLNSYSVDIHGEWYVAKKIGSSMFVGLSDYEIEMFRNKCISYYEDRVIIDDTIYFNTVYNQDKIDEIEFFKQFRASFADIGAQTNMLSIIEIKYIKEDKEHHLPGPGSTVIYFNNTLCIFWAGIFFKLEKIK